MTDWPAKSAAQPQLIWPACLGFTAQARLTTLARCTPAAIVWLMALLLIASTGVQTYRIDQAASNASARVSFLGLGSKSARFNSIAGTVSLTANQASSARINVTINAKDITAPDKVTLKRLKSEKFFWVEKHPTVRFSGTNLEMTSARQGRITGTLTARGVSRAETLYVTFDRDPRQAGSAPITLSGTMTINRRDYGMRSYQLIVGNKVKIAIKARLLPS